MQKSTTTSSSSATSNSSSALSSSSIYQKIAEKRTNLEKLREFKQLTSDLVIQLESIGNKLETMNEGTASVGLILSNWQSVIKSISLASLALVNNQEDQDTRNNNNQQDDKFPEPLVRIKLDQLNQNNDHQEQQQQHQDIGELEDDEELEQEEAEYK